MEIKTRFDIGQTVYRINRENKIIPFKVHSITINDDSIVYHNRQGHFLLEDELYKTEEEARIVLGRKAKCEGCGKIVNSATNLPFFQHKKEKEYDTYYCGCWGWD